MTLYELLLEDEHAGRRPRMLPLACASAAEVLPRVQQILRERRLKSIEVRWFGKRLFTLRA